MLGESIGSAWQLKRYDARIEPYTHVLGYHPSFWVSPSDQLSYQNMAEGGAVLTVTPPVIEWDGQDVPQSFKRFKRYTEIILKTPSFADKGAKDRANYILLWLGPKGVEIFDNMTLTAAQREDPTAILNAFTDYLEPKANFRLARLQLRDMLQETHEPIDSYLTKLKTQANKCNFGTEDAKNDALIDQMIKGTAHHAVRKQLLDKNPNDLTLHTATDMARIFEATQLQLKLMEQAPQPETRVDYIHNKSSEKCRYCGRSRHDRSRCPAKDDTCKKCEKTGHWAKVCLSSSAGPSPGYQDKRKYLSHEGKKPNQGFKHKSSIHAVREESEPLREEFEQMSFNTIEISTIRQSEAFAKIQFTLLSKTHFLEGKVDTGAQGNLLPMRTYEKILKVATLPTRTSSMRLSTYSGEKIPHIGTVTLDCRKESTSDLTPIEFYVTNSPGPVIFGLPTCVKLGLVTMNCSIMKNADGIEDLSLKYPDRFQGIGQLKGKYKLTLKDDVQPIIHPPRRAPIQLRDQIRAELQRMTDLEVIKPMEEPTDWVSSITYVKKKDGSLRICLDPRDLNCALMRAAHPIPTTEEVTYKLMTAKYFSKLDAKSGYWSICLDEESQHLTTFNTPFGRYCFRRLPFGLKTSQDVFQLAMDRTLEGLPGVIAIADDIVVYGSTIKEHDDNLQRLMERARQQNLVFNKEKCLIKCKEVTFFGNIYSPDGVRPDPAKVQAIYDLKTPTSSKDVQSFLGMVTYLSSHIPKLSEHTTHLRKLLQKDSLFQWCHEHQQSFERIKRLICEATTLAYFDPSKETIIQVDASLAAVGAALTQNGKIVAFASKSLSPCEQRYANIERELLACVFGAERFHSYVFGKHFVIESDHKPLEMIAKKSLSAAPARLQRMLLRLQRYDYSIVYQPGRDMILADSLSRMPSKATSDRIVLDYQVCLIQFSQNRLDVLRAATKEDAELNILSKYVVTGFPLSRREMHSNIRNYWSFRDELSMEDGILLKGSRIIVPLSLQPAFLEDIHTGHLGITRCQQRARSSVYWPNIDRDIQELIKSCSKCQTHQASLSQEEIMPVASETPMIPWYTLGTDLFVHEGDTYLIIADYMSKYPIVEKISGEMSSKHIAAITLKYICMFGIPNTIISDNGPQFIGQAYQQLMKAHGICHITSSPHHPRSHGFIEREIRTVKAIMKKEENRHLYAMLVLRTTPLGSNTPSPAELLFGRKVPSNLPIRTSGPNNDNLRTDREQPETTGKDPASYNIDDPIYFQDAAKKTWSPGIIIGVGPEPRSYTIQCSTTSRQLRRNCTLIRKRFANDSSANTPERQPAAVKPRLTPPPCAVTVHVPSSHHIPTQHISRYGRPLKRPTRYDD